MTTPLSSSPRVLPAPTEDKHPTAPTNNPEPAVIETTEDPGGPIQPIPYHAPVARLPLLAGVRLLPVLLLAVLSLLGSAAWFVFTAESVHLDIDPPPDRVEIAGAWLAPALGDRYLLRPGVYTVIAEKAGFQRAERRLEVTAGRRQTLSLGLEKLPGLLTITARPVIGARVFIDGKEAGLTPLARLELAPGRHSLVIRAERYLEHWSEVAIEGGGLSQSVEIDLTPAWAAVTFNSIPAGAEVSVDGVALGVTPLTADLEQGEREVEFNLTGHRTWQHRLTVIGDQPRILPEVALEKADGLVSIRTKPEIGIIRLVTVPEGAEVYIDGMPRGSATQRLRLTAAPHQLEIKKAGFVPYRITVTPQSGFEQEFFIRLQPLGKPNAAAVLSGTGNKRLSAVRMWN